MDRRRTDQAKEVEIPDIGQIIKILYKRKFFLLLTVLVPLFITGMYLKSKPDIYRATTSIKIDAQNFNMSEFQDVLSSVKFDKLTVPTQIEVIQSKALLRKTISAIGIALNDNGQLIINPAKRKPLGLSGLSQDSVDYEVIKQFNENLHVEQQSSSRIIEIYFDSQAPELAAKIVNTHAEHYRQSIITTKQEQARKLKDWISGQIVSLKEQNLTTSRAVQKFKSDNGMVKGLTSEDLIYEQISNVAKQLNPLATRELDLQARVELLQQGQASAIKEVIDSDLIQSLKSRESIATQHLQSLRADYGNNHPEVISAQHEVSQINADINREISNIRRSIQNELTTAVKQKELLNAKLQDLQHKADTFQENMITLESLQLEEAASRKLLDNFLARSEEINSQVNLERQDVSILSHADVPGEPMGSRKTVILLAVAMLSGLLALSIIFLLEIIDRGIDNRDDVKKILKLKLLGTLPKENAPLKRILSKNRSAYVEEIKRIYIHLSAMNEAQSILFTSARIGEGKSMTAISLAYYLHAIGKKVVLVDANTLTPQISSITGVRKAPGFYELLAGTHTLDETISTSETGVSILPAGEQNPFSSDLLVAGRFKEQIQKMKESYDFVIIDCACALEASDAEVLAALTDQTVIVTAWAKTPKKDLIKVSELMRTMSPTTPSIILNKIPLKDLKVN